MISASIAFLPDFLIYLASGLGLLLLFSLVYTVITPHNEISLIRQGNIATALGFGGALLGYTLPLASAIAHSVSVVDMLIWGAIGLGVQIAVLGTVRLAIPFLFRDMEDGKVAPAIMLALVAICAGVINAASMTY